MMTFQLLQGNVNTTRGPLKLTLPTELPVQRCLPTLAMFVAAIQAKERLRKGTFHANHTIDFKKLTPDQFISNHSMNVEFWRGRDTYKNIFSQ